MTTPSTEQQWTRTPPTEPYTYWWYQADYSDAVGVDLCEVRPRQSFRSGEGTILVAQFTDGSEVRDLSRGWWLGPVTPPKGPPRG